MLLTIEISTERENWSFTKEAGFKRQAINTITGEVARIAQDNKTTIKRVALVPNRRK